MKKSNKIERSETWNNIYEVLARLDLKENTGDCLDRPSAATELEQLFLNLVPIQNVVTWTDVDITPQEKQYIVHYENGKIDTDEFISGRFIYGQFAELKVTHYSELPIPPCLQDEYINTSNKLYRMKKYRVAIYNNLEKKKRYVNIQGSNIENVIKIANYNIVNHVMEEVVKIERWYGWPSEKTK